MYLANDDGRVGGVGRKWPARKAGAEPEAAAQTGEHNPVRVDEQ